MRVERDWLRKLVFEMSTTKRFTQESPILPEVWLSGGVAYCRGPEVRVDLLLTPHKDQTAGILARAILEGLNAAFATSDYARSASAGPLGKSDDAPLTKPTWTLSVNQTTVAASLTFKELITCALPLSPWWQRNFVDPEDLAKAKESKRDRAQREDEIDWMRRLVGVIALCARRRTGPPARRRADADDPWTATQTAHRAEGATIADHDEYCEVVEDESGQRALFEQWIAQAKKWGARRKDKRGDHVNALWSIGLNRQSLTAITALGARHQIRCRTHRF